MLRGKHERWSWSHLHWTGNHKIPGYCHLLLLLEPTQQYTENNSSPISHNRKQWFQRLCSHLLNIHKEWTSVALGTQTWDLLLNKLIFLVLKYSHFTCSSQTPDSSSGAQRIMVLSIEADNNLIGCCRIPSKEKNQTTVSPLNKKFKLHTFIEAKCIRHVQSHKLVHVSSIHLSAVCILYKWLCFCVLYSTV